MKLESDEDIFLKLKSQAICLASNISEEIKESVINLLWESLCLSEIWNTWIISFTTELPDIDEELYPIVEKLNDVLWEILPLTILPKKTRLISFRN